MSQEKHFNREYENYWGEKMMSQINEEYNSEEREKEDKINKEIIEKFEVEKFFKEIIDKKLITSDENNLAWIDNNKEKHHNHPFYTSLIFNEDETKRHWSEVMISVFDGKLCLVRHKPRGDQYNYYPIEEGGLEEAIERGVRHPTKWNLNSF